MLSQNMQVSGIFPVEPFLTMRTRVQVQMSQVLRFDVPQEAVLAKLAPEDCETLRASVTRVG